MTRARALWIAAAIGIVIAALWVDAGVLAERVLPGLVRTELGTLDRLAGLRGADGRARVTEPVPVRVESDAPGTADAIIRAAIADDDVYAAGEGPHRLIAELVVLDHACALRLSLERRGWRVHAPTPSRRRLQPALVIVPALLGLAMWSRRRDRVLALSVAAALAQLAVSLWPWPAALPPGSVQGDVLSGPLLGPWIGLAHALDEQGSAIAGGVIALCLVLAWFDHRRSRDRPASTLLRGLAGVLAVLALVEAASRAAVPAWCSSLPGAVASLGLLVLLWRTDAVWRSKAGVAKP